MIMCIQIIVLFIGEEDFVGVIIEDCCMLIGYVWIGYFVDVGRVFWVGDIQQDVIVIVSVSCEVYFWVNIDVVILIGD